MLFLKLTRSAKRFGARFGWLIEELVLVFLGMYGAFLLERMHDDDMDLLRKRQILQALVDEFEDYENYWARQVLRWTVFIAPFFILRTRERPFPNPILWRYGDEYRHLGGDASSGGIEVLKWMLSKRCRSFKSCRIYSIYIPVLRDSPSR